MSIVQIIVPRKSDCHHEKLRHWKGSHTDDCSISIAMAVNSVSIPECNKWLDFFSQNSALKLVTIPYDIGAYIAIAT